MASRSIVGNLSSESLLSLGFIDVANWAFSGNNIDIVIDGPHAQANELRLIERNALYAFVRDDEVLYIGKTARTIQERFNGYRRPSKGQTTNTRCNTKIKEAIRRREEIRIFIFNPVQHLRYGIFDLNIAAGLEDSLIASFNPPWNGRDRGAPITEEAERENAEASADPAARFAWSDEDVIFKAEDGKVMNRHEIREAQTRNALAQFTILLGQAYYRQGLVNPGSEASKYLGQDGEPIEIEFSDGAVPVVSRIDRKANRSGAVRVVGRNSAIARWFQVHFVEGDVVHARVLDANRILLLVQSSDAVP